MYRKLYEWVLIARKNNDDSFLYDLNPYRFEENVNSILETMFSCSLKYYYGTPIILIIFIIAKI